MAADRMMLLWLVTMFLAAFCGILIGIAMGATIGGC